MCRKIGLVEVFPFSIIEREYQSNIMIQPLRTTTFLVLRSLLVDRLLTGLPPSYVEVPITPVLPLFPKEEIGHTYKRWFLDLIQSLTGNINGRLFSSDERCNVLFSIRFFILYNPCSDLIVGTPIYRLGLKPHHFFLI